MMQIKVAHFFTNQVRAWPLSVYEWLRRTECRRFLGSVHSPSTVHLRSPWCNRDTPTLATLLLLRNPDITTEDECDLVL